jgi:uncharacterized SAM-binding protein YcdF (DUF218 family)
LAGITWLFRAQLMTAAADCLIESDKSRPADAIVVLGGDEYGERITTAAELQRKGLAPFVVVSGPPMLIGHQSDMTIEFARRKGYPASIFHAAENNLNSTRSEVQFLGRYLKQHDIARILLVTSNFHTRRAARLMRTENPRLDVIVIPAPDPFFAPSTWWETRNGQKTFAFEWLKSISSCLGN